MATELTVYELLVRHKNGLGIFFIVMIPTTQYEHNHKQVSQAFRWAKIDFVMK